MHSTMESSQYEVHLTLQEYLNTHQWASFIKKHLKPDHPDAAANQWSPRLSPF